MGWAVNRVTLFHNYQQKKKFRLENMSAKVFYPMDDLNMLVVDYYWGRGFSDYNIFSN